MTLIERVAQLRELEETQSTKEWAVSERFHGNPNEWIVAGRNLNRQPKIAVCSTQNRAEYITEHLNAAPALLAILGAFHDEDAELLKGIQHLVEQFDEILLFTNNEVEAAKKMLARLAEAARAMEAKKDDP